MRTLGIETSTRRGSLALLDGDELHGSVEHDAPNAHSERLLPMLEELLASAGWARTSIDRIAVGRGPGSFVGLRVGIALAEGLSLGLGRPVVGVVSLAAMALALPPEAAGVRAALLDARQNELFVYACTPAGVTVIEPRAVPRAEVAPLLRAAGAQLVVGEVAPALGLDIPHSSGPDLDLPHARAVARIGSAVQPEPGAAVLPLYIRGPGATLPNLPPSPFGARGA